MIKKLLILITLAMLACAQASAIGNPGAGYFVIHNANEHHDDRYQHTGGFTPSWANEIPMFMIVNMGMMLISVLGVCLAKSFPLLFIIVLVMWVVVFVAYDIPQFQKFTNTTQTFCEMKANGNINVSC
jgi:hypothetical protein